MVCYIRNQFYFLFFCLPKQMANENMKKYQDNC